MLSSSVRLLDIWAAPDPSRNMQDRVTQRNHPAECASEPPRAWQRRNPTLGDSYRLGPEREDIRQGGHLHQQWCGESATPHPLLLLLERYPRLAAWTSTCIAHSIACASSFLHGEIIPVHVDRTTRSTTAILTGIDSDRLVLPVSATPSVASVKKVKRRIERIVSFGSLMLLDQIIRS